MLCFTTQRFYKKILPLAVTSVLATITQSNYADSITEASSQKKRYINNVVETISKPVSTENKALIAADTKTTNTSHSQQPPLLLQVTESISATLPGYIDISANKDGATDINLKERPDAIIALNGGRMGRVIGNGNTANTLFLIRGSIDTAENFGTVSVSGSDWVAKKPFSNIRALDVDSKGSLNELHVYGPKAPAKITEANQILKFTTTHGQWLQFVVQGGGKFGALKIYDKASLGDLYLNNGQVEFMLDNKASFELGRITNASFIRAPEFAFEQVLIGGKLQQVSRGKNLVVNTDKQNPVSLSCKNITNLQITTGAHLTGNINDVVNIQILSSDFLSTGWINAQSLIADVPMNTVNIGGSNEPIKPFNSQLNIRTTTDHPFIIKSNQPVQNISRLNILENATLSTIDSVNEVQIEGAHWRTQGLVNNLSTLNILPNGVADKIMVVSSRALTVSDHQLMHLHFDQHKTYGSKDAFSINTVGKPGAKPGTVKLLDFSANVNRPKLTFSLQGGQTEKAIGRQDREDELILVKGQLKQATGFHTLTLDGAQWDNTLVLNPLNINHSAGKTGALSVKICDKPMATGKGTLSLFYTQKTAPVKLASSGVIKDINLVSSHDRPDFFITQEGASVNAITGDIGKKDQFTAKNTTVKQLKDLTLIKFIGSNRYEGDRIQSSGRVNVFGTLNFAADRTTITPSVARDNKNSPALKIYRQATIATPSEIIVDGSYHQQGRLVLTDKTPHSGRFKPVGTKGEAPVVKAHSIVVEPGAEFVFDSVIMKAPASGKQYLLMEAQQSNINRPVKVHAQHETHLHYDAIVDPKNPKRMLLTTTTQAEHRSKLVSEGLRSMITAATDNKEAAKGSEPNSNRVQLTRYIVQNINAKSSNGAAVNIAPSLSPHASYNANLALKTSGKNLDERMSARRTGINSGDMSSSGGAWLQYSYSKATQGKQDYIPGYRAKTNGFSIGVDSGLAKHPNIETGVAYTYVKGDTQQEDQPANTIDSDAHIFSLYASSAKEQTFIDGRVSYAFGKNKGNRTVNNSHNEAKYDTKSWSLGLTTGYKYPLNDDWSLQPQAAFNYLTIKTEDYTEAARNPSQSFLSFDQVNNDRYNLLELGGGLKLIGNVNTNRFLIKPEFGLTGLHDFKKDPIAIIAHFADGGERFLIHGAKKQRNRYQFDATVNMVINNTALSLSYSHHWAGGFKANGLLARVRWIF